MRGHITIAVALALSSSSFAGAQAQRPRAELTASADPADVRAGATTRVSLKVKLPADVHVQSDKPRDPSLIPTVLTVNAPSGVTVERITYPAPTDLAQKGRNDKLAVFGPEFAIDVRLAIASTASAGELVVPARLRYQACNDRLCFPPTSGSVEWKLRVQ